MFTPWHALKRGVGAVYRGWMLYHLADEHFAFMYADPPADEWVALEQLQNYAQTIAALVASGHS